jgi:hypothetical protein
MPTQFVSSNLSNRASEHQYLTLVVRVVPFEIEERLKMATSLIKKAFLPLKTAIPMPVMTDNLLNHEEIKCPHCPQPYILGYSEGEQFRLERWRVRAGTAISRSHGDGHELMALALPGIP